MERELRPDTDGARSGPFAASVWRNPYRKSDVRLAVAVKAALARQDDDYHSTTAAAGVRGACPRCPTDFAVHGSSDCAELCVWRNLWLECSPTSLAWKVRVSALRGDHRNGIHVGLTVHHEPGSICEFYDGADECLKHPVARELSIRDIFRFVRRTCLPSLP